MREPSSVEVQMRVAPQAVLAMTTGIASVLGLLAAVPETRAQQATPVRLEKLFLVDSSRGPIRSVAFSFEFPGMDSVAIKGLGIVPARGAFRYLTLDDKLEFLDPK